ncbi:hypothetical protein FHS78_000671 [Parvibaculum indicum]|uniref:hypothetical protein n=1 Tax=Parvibaculum indicum TaxID=562969 RepID=UPI0014215C60|nr:hypothetical protein [Parvibaculum indicum]NIJ40401.1 hypothetical protein [Parvibaculum indicum]
METPEQGERQHSWYAVTDGSWQWDTGEAPPFITHTDSPRAAVEEAIKDWFEKGQDFDGAELKVARLETCAFTFVEVDENRKWRLERWWDYPSSAASAGLVTVPVEDLARLRESGASTCVLNCIETQPTISRSHVTQPTPSSAQHRERAPMGDVHEFKSPPLEKTGCGRDAECAASLVFYFNRPLSDDELRFLDECLSRSVQLMPKGSQ